MGSCTPATPLSWGAIVGQIDRGSPMFTLFSAGDSNGCMVGGHFRVVNGYAAAGVPTIQNGTMTLATTQMLWVQDPDPVDVGDTELVQYTDWACTQPNSSSPACWYMGHWADAYSLQVQ